MANKGSLSDKTCFMYMSSFDKEQLMLTYSKTKNNLFRNRRLPCYCVVFSSSVQYMYHKLKGS